LLLDRGGLVRVQLVAANPRGVSKLHLPRRLCGLADMPGELINPGLLAEKLLEVSSRQLE
jgi:hypothetical protein